MRLSSCYYYKKSNNRPVFRYGFCLKYLSISHSLIIITENQHIHCFLLNNQIAKNIVVLRFLHQHLKWIVITNITFGGAVKTVSVLILQNKTNNKASRVQSYYKISPGIMTDKNKS